MATNFSNRRVHDAPSWRQQDLHPDPVSVQNDANKLSNINEKRKHITYEKEYFFQMLQNIENDSKTIKSLIPNNSQNLGHGCTKTLYKNTNERNHRLDNKKVNNKECRHSVRQGLTSQTSEDMVGVVDKIIEKTKDIRATNPSPISIATNNTNDAGEMLNYLLNKTYPNRFQGRGRQKSASPTRRDAFSNENKQKELQNYRSAWTNMKNNSSKDKLTKPPRWNFSTRIDTPYVSNGITARCGQNNIADERPKTCKPKYSRSTFCSPQRSSLSRPIVVLNKKRSWPSAQNGLENQKQFSKSNGNVSNNQNNISSSIAISMSTSSSNLSASSRISSISSSSANNDVPSLEIVGRSSQLSPSPFSSNGCTPRGTKCQTVNNDGKHSAELQSVNVKKSQTKHLSATTIQEHLDPKLRPKSSSALEMGNIVLKNYLHNNVNLKEVKSKKQQLPKRNESNAEEKIKSQVDPISPSRLSPSKRGVRRMRSREIIEELQIQLNNSPELIAQRQLQQNHERYLINKAGKNSMEGILDRDKVSEMRKLVHELDNNLSISSQQSSSSSSKEEKCDACIHTQPISPTDGSENQVLPTPHKVRRHNLRTIQVDRKDLHFSDKNVIGKGTFSTVYHGKLLGMDVAVKSFKLDTHISQNNILNQKMSLLDKNKALKEKREEVKERFEAEGHLMLRLRHPHIIQLLGCCPMETDSETTASPLLVFEYLESGSLSHYVHEVTQAPLDHATLFSVGRDIALALNYLHNRKLPVVHLDVKSANVLLDAYLRAKIADLGLAQPLPPTKKNDVKCEKSVTLCCLKGTPAFMAPEVLKDRHVSTAADVYGFGIILWEMSVAMKPFDGMDLVEVCNCVCSGIRPRLPETLSQPLSNLIQQCWHQVPGERPTCATILQTLGTLSFPDNWKALLGTSTNTIVKHEESRGTSKLENDERLKVIAEDTELIGNRKLDNEVSNSPITIENNVNLDELEESPRAPLYSRSMSAPIPTPPPPPPMPKPSSIFTVPNIVTPDPGKRSGLVDSSGGVYGFGITTEEIQRQKKLLKSRISDESSSYLNGSSSNSDDLTSVLKRVLDKRRECRSDDEDDISEQNSLASRKEPKERLKNKRTKSRRRRSLSQSSSRDSPSTNSCWSTSDEL